MKGAIDLNGSADLTNLYTTPERPRRDVGRGARVICTFISLTGRHTLN